MSRILRLEYNTYGGVDIEQISTGWVDISSYVDWRAGVNIRRGRTDESASVSAGSMNFTLSNLNGEFIPGNTSSPFYPDITIPMWMRLTVVDTVTLAEWIRFSGLTESFQPYVAGPGADRSTVVTVTDPMQRLGKFKKIDSFLAEEIKLDNPIAYYPLTDGKDSVTFGDLSGNNQPPLTVSTVGITGTLEPASVTGPPGALASTPAFKPQFPSAAGYNNSYGKYLHATLRDPLVIGTGHAYTIEWWMLINDLGATDDHDLVTKLYAGVALTPPSGGNALLGGYYLCDGVAGTAVDGPAVVYSCATGFRGSLVMQQGDFQTQASPNRAYGGHLMPGIWHHCAITSDGAGTASGAAYYLNGHPLTAVTPPTFLDPPITAVQNATDLQVGGLTKFGSLMNGSVAHVALYDTDIGPTRIKEHYMAGRTGFTGEDLDDRMVRVLRYAGIGTSVATLPVPAAVGVDPTPVITQGDDTALALCQELANTGQGIFLFAPTGAAQYLPRTHRYTSTVLSLSVAPGTGDVGPAGIQPVFDSQRILNDVTTSSGVGTSARVTDAASIAARGLYQQDIDTVAGSPYVADETSRWVIAGRADPQHRIPDVTVQLATRSSAFNALVLAASIWDRVAFTSLPTGYVFPEQAIEGINERWSITEQSITFNLSPNAPQPATVYQVGVTGSDEINTSAARIGY